MKPLEYRRIYFDLILLFKIYIGISDIKFDDYFILRTRPYNIRGNTRKIEPKLNNIKDTEWCMSFFVRSPKIWNDLPNEIASSTSINIFKSKLNKFDLTQVVKLDCI